MKKITDLSEENIFIAPSLLAADFANLESEISGIENGGAEILHLDIMDGHFVPNLTMGPPLIKSLRSKSDLIFDTHLMLTDPIDYIESFKTSGADHITFHVECRNNIDDVINLIRKNSMTVGLSVKPGTPYEAILPYLDKIDLILVMTVEPGFGGQSFMENMMPKVKAYRNEVIKTGKKIHIQVDGGIDNSTISIAKNAGANVMVAGTSVFRSPSSVKSAISELLKK